MKFDPLCRCYCRRGNESPEATWVGLADIPLLVDEDGILHWSGLQEQYMPFASLFKQITVTEAASRVKHPGLKELLLRLSDA